MKVLNALVVNTVSSLEGASNLCVVGEIGKNFRLFPLNAQSRKESLLEVYDDSYNGFIDSRVTVH